jgi:hypothetical protein
MDAQVNVVKEEELDLDWMRLLLTAKDMGITPTEIRVFLSQGSKEE